MRNLHTQHQLPKQAVDLPSVSQLDNCRTTLSTMKPLRDSPARQRERNTALWRNDISQIKRSRPQRRIRWQMDSSRLPKITAFEGRASHPNRGIGTSRPDSEVNQSCDRNDGDHYHPCCRRDEPPTSRHSETETAVPQITSTQAQSKKTRDERPRD
jgi:hypothetical protein